MPRCLLGVGSNLGDRIQTLEAALAAVREQAHVVAVSDWYSNPAVGGETPQGEFINGVWVVDFDESVTQVVRRLQRIEADWGRSRGKRWDARPLDIDLLLVGSQVIDSEALIVPHPRMITRRFVLQPAQQVAADWIHPLTEWTLARHYRHLAAFPWFVFAGRDGEGLGSLATTVAARVGARVWPEPSGELDLGSVKFGPLVGEGWLNDGEAEPVFSVAVVHEGWSKLAHAFDGDRAPKVIFVTAPRSDPATDQLYEQVAGRSPIVHLSAGWSDAIQDAVGTIQAMK